MQLIYNLQYFEMFNTLQDIKLQTIDYEWIEQRTKISHLKRAIRLIELDGDYFKQLKDACYKRMAQIDPSLQRIVVSNNISHQTKLELQKQLAEWQKTVEQTKQKQKIFDPNLQDYQNYFNKDQSSQKSTKIAERQKNKGNQAIKSKDYDQAIIYYTKSLNADPSMYQSYCNRALAHLKKKQFQKCLNDCQSALRINPRYTKALHRKAKAYISLKRKTQGYKCLQQALKIQPDNSQLNKQIQQLWQDLTEDQKSILNCGNDKEKKSQFKRVIIQEDSDDQK